MRRSSIKVALALLSLTAAPSAAFAATGWEIKQHSSSGGITDDAVAKRCGSKQGTYTDRLTSTGLYPKKIVFYMTIALVVDGKRHKYHLVKLAGPEWNSSSPSQRAKLTRDAKARLAPLSAKTISVHGNVLVGQSYYKGKKLGKPVTDHLLKIHC